MKSLSKSNKLGKLVKYEGEIQGFVVKYRTYKANHKHWVYADGFGREFNFIPSEIIKEDQMCVEINERFREK